MNPKKLNITELDKILIAEFYKSYRESPEGFIDGTTFFKHLKRKFQDQFIINENDFIVSLESLQSKWIIEKINPMGGGIPRYIKVKSSIVSHFEGFQSVFLNLQKTTVNRSNSKIYIPVNFKDYNLTEFDRVIPVSYTHLTLPTILLV